MVATTFSWHKPLFHIYRVIPQFSCRHPFRLLLFKHLYLLMESLWYQLLCFLLRLCCFFFFISYLPFFCYFSYFHCFPLFLFLLPLLFPTSSSVSSFFCFSHPDFSCTGLYCFPHSFGHLIILTSPVLQSISELWRASHGIPKITFYFCPPITSISVLSLCP